MRKRKNGIKSDGPQITFDLVFSTAVKIVVVFAIAMVFVRNVIPFQKEAIVLDSVPAPESSVSSDVQSSKSTSSGSSLLSSEQSESSISESANSESSEPASSAASVSVPQVKDPKTTSSKININTASIEQLKTLNGIGDVKAKAIVEYREKNGGFKSVDELDNVDGIGKATIDKLRDQITV